MEIILIAAHDPNLTIGKDGGLPWRYPEDLKHFKETTQGNVVLMGRGVFEELNEVPLPNRHNVVLSRTKTYEQVQTYSSLEEALEELADVDIYVIGGGVLYRETIDFADRLIITEIKKDFDGDTFFPEYRNLIGTIWKEVKRDDREELSFVEYERI
jgi:dihydrofolate reductase